MPHYDDDDDIDYDRDAMQGWDDEDGYAIAFADPYGRSALRAATADNPRELACPTCGAPNTLTPADVERGYQCDVCADAAERGQS